MQLERPRVSSAQQHEHGGTARWVRRHDASLLRRPSTAWSHGPIAVIWEERQDERIAGFDTVQSLSLHWPRSVSDMRPWPGGWAAAHSVRR